MVNRKDNWELAEIYADEGISGTSLKHRDAFVRMIEDCQKGKLDMIVTKSVSRFARNVVDCIGYVRALAAMNPPIGVFFETENIYTLNSNAEMSLSFISTLAQEESHTKSEIMNSSIEMRFRRGIFLTPILLGFDHDGEGNLIINEEEAKTVRLCFLLYYSGYTSTFIANLLTKLKRKTKRQNDTWSSGTILSLLQNERYCGDVLARKTWTPNYLDHKSRKNKHDRNQYLQKDHHDSIIPRDLFVIVQHMIQNQKYGRHSHLPNLFVVPDGPFQGFVLMNPHWASYKADDYRNASVSVYDDILEIQAKPLEIKVNAGQFDFRHCEVTRMNFIQTRKRAALLLKNKHMAFSKESILQLNKCEYVEIFIHPEKYLLLVTPAAVDQKNSIFCAKVNNDLIHIRNIADAALFPIIYELCGWDENCSYLLVGALYGTHEHPYIVFDLHDTEIFMTANLDNTSKKINVYPAAWEEDFGENYYIHEHDEFNNILLSNSFSLVVHPVTNLFLTSYTEDEIKEEIKQLILEMKNEQSNE